MAAPTIVAANSGARTSNSTSHTINLPDGSDVAGRRLVMGFTIDNQQAVTWPAGWNEITSVDGPSGNSRLYIVYYDITGSEGYPATGATDTATTATSDGSSHVTFLISGHDAGTAPEVTTATQAGTGADPNPPSITPAGGSKDYLFLAFGGTDGTNGAPSFTGFPTNYSLNQTSATSGFNGGTSTGGAGRQLTTAGPEDPSAFTLSGAEQREAATVVIHPAAAGSPVTVTPDVGVLTLTGFAPTIGLPRTVVTGLGQLVLAGFAPEIGTGPTVVPGLGQLTLTGFAPTLGLPRTVTPGLGQLTITGFAPKITTNPVTVSPGVGSLVLAGFAPTLPIPVTVRPGLGQLTFTGFDPSVFTTAPGVGWVEFDIIVESTGTTFNFKWAQLVSNAQPLFVKAGSYIEYARIS